MKGQMYVEWDRNENVEQNGMQRIGIVHKRKCDHEMEREQEERREQNKRMIWIEGQEEMKLVRNGMGNEEHKKREKDKINI